MVITRGSVIWADLGPVDGSAPAKVLPVLAVQADEYNRSQISTILVLAMTSNTAQAQFPGNVFVPASASGLPKDSVVNVSQCSSIDRDSLGDHVSDLPAYLMAEVDAGLRRILAL